ncbi:hypothetical protein PIB30_065149 [Stylosanthes scabra]|uniref:Uncharacterized protein n=1 Tax=Stylosanthes scabra TaxID=79078 RepID=A0ABU6YKN7_9FABA|nr:hypothetical protein [Stylosanthes scabra]
MFPFFLMMWQRVIMTFLVGCGFQNFCNRPIIHLPPEFLEACLRRLGGLKRLFSALSHFCYSFFLLYFPEDFFLSLVFFFLVGVSSSVFSSSRYPFSSTFYLHFVYCSSGGGVVVFFFFFWFSFFLLPCLVRPSSL